jgi:methylamine---glutamate N-methyltransferase subunit C
MAKVPLAGTTYIPGQTEERALAEIKALLEKQIANDGMGGRNG